VRRPVAFAGGVGRALLLGLCVCAAGCRDRRVVRTQWPVMGTVAAVQTRAGDSDHAAALSTAQAAFRQVEKLLNAHDPRSELRRLSARTEDEILAACSPEVRPCYAAAFRLAAQSGGAFNPRWRGAATLDLGAIAKGFAVDRAAAALSSATGAILLDLGGNVKAVCPSASGAARTWRTGVRSPDGNGICAVVQLRDGEAIATSASYYRGRHIFDGRTGRPACGAVASVTVLCRSAMLADGLSTTLYVLGPEEGLSFLARSGYDASVLFLLTDGRRIATDARFEPVAPPVPTRRRK
jgi:thiamine biosynthesis lipoprotein